MITIVFDLKWLTLYGTVSGCTAQESFVTSESQVMEKQFYTFFFVFYQKLLKVHLFNFKFVFLWTLFIKEHQLKRYTKVGFIMKRYSLNVKKKKPLFFDYFFEDVFLALILYKVSHNIWTVS